MKTWRERIVEAREREQRYKRAWFWQRPKIMRESVGLWPFGRWPFTVADYEAWRDIHTCLAGETAHAYGIYDHRRADLLFLIGNRFLAGVTSPDEADAMLDQIEDRALELKREAPERSEAHGEDGERGWR